ncbi:MAG: DNA-binding transcription factor [Claussenomyces sp. TS43310]|nr:MAG: DNA-binding transcription factor [Claussenomyces sp. TS43310]
MEHRGRSPSGAHQQLNISHGNDSGSQSLSDLSSVDLGSGLDGATSGSHNSQQQQQQQQQRFSNSGYPTTHSLSYENHNTFFSSPQDPQYPQTTLPEGFDPTQAFNSQAEFNQFKQEDISSFGPPTSFSQDFLDASTFNGADFSLYSPPAGSEAFDASFFLNDSSQAAAQSINPADLMNDMSSPMNHVSTTPYLKTEPQQSSSAHQSPLLNQSQSSHSPKHSRHTSLGPESAAFPQAHLSTDWTGMMPPQFTTHRRSPSEYSDVSSAAPSPHLLQQDTFDSVESHHSPLLQPLDPNLYADGLGIGSFSLSDPNIQQSSSPGRGRSPVHSLGVPSQSEPQLQLPTIAQQNQFLQSMGFPQSSEVYNGLQGPYGQDQIDPADMGQAQQMVPPEINVEFAPASRQNSFDPPKPLLDQDALTPPERGT